MSGSPFSRDASLRAERFGCHAHGFAWAWKRPHAHTKLWAWHPLFPALVFMLFLAAPALAQQAADAPPPRRPIGQDTFVFRDMLKRLDFKPITSVDELLDHPQNKILIVLGKPDFAERLAKEVELNQFLRSGGALLLATDRQTSDRLKSEIGVQVSGKFVAVRPEDGYRKEFSECVLMMPALLKPGASRHRILAGIGEDRPVVTNRPSFLSFSAWTIVAELHTPNQGYRFGPRLDFVPDRLNQVPDRLMFATAWEVSDKGRAVVLADHSLFIDEMMGQTDNDNITFAANVVRWLSNDGRRKEVMLWDDGNLWGSFDVDLSFGPPPFPPIEALVPLANQMIGEMEQENLFNRMLVDAAGGPDRILRGLLLFFTLGLIAQGGYRFLNSKFRTELRPAKAAPAAAPVPDLERRHQAILTRGNLVESAHELAHQTFVALAVESEKDELSRLWWERAALGSVSSLKLGPYRVFVMGSGWEREFRLRRVWRLWRTATGRVRYVSARRLERIVDSLRDLHEAVSAGKIHLVTIHRSRRPGGALTR